MSSFSSHFLISAALRGAALIGGRRLLEGGAYIEIEILGAALIRGRRLKDGGGYWRKYGKGRRQNEQKFFKAYPLRILYETLVPGGNDTLPQQLFTHYFQTITQ